MSINIKKLPKGIIFDCDGVIIDSFESNTLFYNKIREAVNLPEMTEEQRMQVHQMTGQEAFELIIPEALRKSASECTKSIDYVKDIVPMLHLYDGLHDLLNFCKNNGIFLGIHTNRIIAMQEILEIHNLAEFYNPVMTPAILPAKPDPIGSLEICKQWGIKPEEALFIGDSNNDRKTALAANIPLIGFKNDDLETENIAHSFKEIQIALEKLI